MFRKFRTHGFGSLDHEYVVVRMFWAVQKLNRNHRCRYKRRCDI